VACAPERWQQTIPVHLHRQGAGAHRRAPGAIVRCEPEESRRLEEVNFAWKRDRFRRCHALRPVLESQDRARRPPPQAAQGAREAGSVWDSQRECCWYFCALHWECPRSPPRSPIRNQRSLPTNLTRSSNPHQCFRRLLPDHCSRCHSIRFRQSRRK